MMDRIANLPPLVDRAFEPELLDALDAAVECDPGQHLRRHIVLAWATTLPDSGIRLVPDLAQMFEQRPLERPCRIEEFQLRDARLMKYVHQLAIDVELQLGMGGIADPHRPRAFVARQPRR